MRISEDEKQAVREDMLNDLGLLMETKPLNKLEIARVSDNMRSHSKSRFFEMIGGALMWSNDEQSRIIKKTFPGEWERWNCELDEHGRLLMDSEDDNPWPL